MVRSEFAFPSADGKTGIHAVDWTPETAPRGVLVIPTACRSTSCGTSPWPYLTERGFAVAGHDHLGHGPPWRRGRPGCTSAPRAAGTGWWRTCTPGGIWRGRRSPGLPVFLLGHSMGSFLARTYFIRYPGTLEGAILMGTG